MSNVPKSVGSLDDQTIEIGSFVKLSDILSTTDTNGISYSWFNIWDATGGHNFVKEGVGAGGSIAAAVLKIGIDHEQFLKLVEEEYNRVLTLQ